MCDANREWSQHGLQNTEKERESHGCTRIKRGCNVGHVRIKCGEVRVRSGGLCALGKGGKNMGVSRWLLQIERGLQKTEKERESGG